MAESKTAKQEKRNVLLHALWGTAKRGLRALAYGIVGGLMVAVVMVVMMLEGRPDLEPWHTADLDEEYSRSADVRSFQEYLALEERLFTQLEEEVYAEVGAGASDEIIDRFHRGIADPARWDSDWNRTFEWRPESPNCGVLLLHGMSDSPYSMRSIAQRMNERGAHVVGLRVPGHGTAPSGLLHVEWEDMAAAVRLAMVHLREENAETPLFIVGYSNGGALAIEYGLEAIVDDALPQAEGIVLLSAAIGLTKLAAMAAWQERLGYLLGLEKLSWNAIEPEINPFKYESFTVNAAKQARRLTLEIQDEMTRVERMERLHEFPRVLAFQSIVDGTIQTSAVVDGLLGRLPSETGNEIVAFDVNRVVILGPLLKSDPLPDFEELLRSTQRSYELTLVTNQSPDSPRAVARRWSPDHRIVVEPLDAEWPAGVFSLSHVALPFRESDSLYGGGSAEPGPGPRLGASALRGERGVLKISPEFMLRQRWNPFYDYMEARIDEFIAAGR